ncbi:MAG: nicotinate (nicotinamide) nucleotide adenylyltransferase [Oscillospiraceae bacterium]|nr:nicotinate (nicotinamide) nucleotide adenylyltransferase [Oscillospiraceae bacterium]MBP1557075.1 nicotinate (nicotinamide) nucleotide adenylyltransferase [Oscillospiraceae bacterium]
MRVGIFGGTFNPIHNGHISLIKHLIAALSLNELLVIPTALPPHKDGSEVISPEHRLAICRLATEDIPEVRVSDIEIKRGGKSYTVNTLRLLLADRPDDEFVLLVGSDMFFTLDEWRCADEIMRLVRVAAIAREENELERLKGCSARYNEKGARTEIVECPVISLSSTELRSDKDRSDGLPPKVERYIIQNGLYGRDKKLLVDLDELTGWLRSRLSRERFTHTLNVASEALRLAETYGENGDEAYLAGLLHDCCKEIPHEEMLNIIENSDIIINQSFKDSPKIWHGFAAAQFIQDEFSIYNSEIIEAVRYHTTGRGEMSRIEEIIYLADLVSADRHYNGVEALRAKAYRSIEEAMLEALQFAITSLGKTAAPILAETVAAYERYRIAVNALKEKAALENDDK